MFEMKCVFLVLSLPLAFALPLTEELLNNNNNVKPGKCLRKDRSVSEDHLERWGYTYRAASPWDYGDTNAWVQLYSTCGGSKQSPINIDPRKAALKSYSKFTFRNYGNIDRMTVTNNGHTVVFAVPTTLASDQVPSISGGGLADEYKLVQFHFHWGSDSSKGSEHTIRSKMYAAELHLVHYNTKYGSMAAATGKSDGLAVLGVLLSIGNQDNSFFNPLVDQLNRVTNEGDEVTLASLVNLQGLLPSRTSTFYRYSGSLTTPACDEIVTWTVFDRSVSISENQISKFRKLLNAEKKSMVNNFRPVQQLNGRDLTYRTYSGCEKPINWPFSNSPIVDSIKWNACLSKYYVTSFFSLFGLSSS